MRTHLERLDLIAFYLGWYLSKSDFCVLQSQHFCISAYVFQNLEVKMPLIQTIPVPEQGQLIQLRHRSWLVQDIIADTQTSPGTNTLHKV